MKKLLAFILCAVVYVSHADMNDVSDNHVYFDFNAGAMNSLSVDTNTSYAGNINAGYMFNNYFGIEGGVIYSPVGILGPAAANNVMNYYSLDAAVKGVIPLSSVFALYGKVGLTQNVFVINSKNVSGMDSTTDSIGGIIGAGAQFNLSKNWSLHLEDDYIPVLNPVYGAGNPNLMFAGAEFKF